MSSSKDIEYSDKYADSSYEYRHVILPKEIAKQLPQGKHMRLLSENEWRSLGVQQSRGWVHYEIHRPEPHVLLFRRPVGTDPVTGKAAVPAPVAQPQQQQHMPLQPMQPMQQQPAALSLAAQPLKKQLAK